MSPVAYALLSVVATMATAADADFEIAQLTIRQRVVIRIPAIAPPVAPRTAPLRWKEKKGPDCVPMSALSAASVIRGDSVDLTLRNGARLRAELGDECPAIDFYSGFYLLPTGDGRVCADRDAIHSRAGGKCSIERFRTLVPDR